MKTIGGVMKIQDLATSLKQNLPTEFHKDLLDAALKNFSHRKNKLRFNNFSYTIRELMRHVFYHHAPDDKVRTSSWFKEEGKPGQVTRRQRVSYMIHAGIPLKNLSPSLRKEITSKTKEIIGHVDDLSKYTHIETHTFDINAAAVRKKAKAVLTVFIETMDLIDACRDEVREYIHDRIQDNLFTVMIENAYDNLEDKSTHTTVDDAVIDGFDITDIDETYIYVQGEGYVECELQYGSGSDLRNDIGAVGGCSFPLKFEATISVNNFTDVNIEPHDVKIDDSSWYD